MWNKRVALLAFWALFLARAVSAQTVTASITGTLRDPSGAVVPNVKVAATNTGTNQTYTAITNESGLYNLLFLQVGDYSVVAEAQGFKKTTLGPFKLEVNQIARVDVKLEVGETTQSVEITGVAPILQTESTATGGLLTAAAEPLLCGQQRGLGIVWVRRHLLRHSIRRFPLGHAVEQGPGRRSWEVGPAPLARWLVHSG